MTTEMIADHTQLKQQMRTLRIAFGAGSAIGHRASNIKEALPNLPHSEQSIKRQLRDIARLAAKS